MITKVFGILLLVAILFTATSMVCAADSTGFIDALVQNQAMGIIITAVTWLWASVGKLVEFAWQNKVLIVLIFGFGMIESKLNDIKKIAKEINFNLQR